MFRILKRQWIITNEGRGEAKEDTQAQGTGGREATKKMSAVTAVSN